MHTKKISLVFRIHMMHLTKTQKETKSRVYRMDEQPKFCTIITLILRLVNSLLNALILVFHLMPLHNIP